MFKSLPQDAREMMSWDWSRLEPYYKDLQQRPLDLDSLKSFLDDWSRLGERVSEIYSRLSVATTVNTADKEAEERYSNYLDNIYPKVKEGDQQIKDKFLKSGLKPDGFELPLKKMRTDAALFREENLPLLAEEEKLSITYDKIVGGQTVNWNGEEKTLLQLSPVYQEQDRALREKAYRLSSERKAEDREKLNDLWKQLLKLRLEIAKNAGYSDFRSFRWDEWYRFDYTPENCIEFQEAIEKVAVPAASRIYKKRSRDLGLDSLRPWDLNVDPLGRPPLRPFDNVTDLQTRTAMMFRKVDPQLGGYFETMMREGLLDLDNRKNKAPGGYCTSFAAARKPFIFANAVGVHDDVQTLLHEAGHAFHTFEKVALPYYPQRSVNLEFAEVASMSMELLAMPYLTKGEGGFYNAEEAGRVSREHYEFLITFWPYMAVVDAFQHWVYENPEAAAEPTELDRKWAELYLRFVPDIDWSGLEETLKIGWQKKLHIFQVPFYYVEYGLAQLGAVQVWKNSLNDKEKAVADYRKALAMGGTASLPELYAAAGAKFAFDEATLSEAVKLIEEKIEELEK